MDRTLVARDMRGVGVLGNISSAGYGVKVRNVLSASDYRRQKATARVSKSLIDQDHSRRVFVRGFLDGRPIGFHRILIPGGKHEFVSFENEHAIEISPGIGGREPPVVGMGFIVPGK